MFSRFLLFLGVAGGGLCAAATGRRGLGARSPAKPCSSVSFAPSPRDFSETGRRRLGARFSAKPCSFVSLAPSPGAFSATGRRGFGARFPAKPCSSVSFAPSPRAFSATGRRGFGARFPAKPCSFVNGHHVFGTKGAASEPDVVLHSPQNLALSSTGTTSLGPKAPPASRTWCFTPRKPLLFRRRAPRLWDQRRRRRAGRGASLTANPCSFVDEHHVFGVKGAAGEPDVVLHSPQ